MKSEDIFAEISHPDSFDFVKRVINNMTPDPIIGPDLLEMLNNNQAETRSFVAWAAKHLQPKKYLEIGVRRGWSLGMVASIVPTCELYCSDIWEPDYPNNWGPPNPGPEFIIGEMKKLGYEKHINFLNGDSHQTIPKFFQENPNIQFDLILVDGDHTSEGAMEDLKNTLPYLSKGGILLFDDIFPEPPHDVLNKVWIELQSLYPHFEYHSYLKNEPGVGIAIKIG